MEATVDTDDSDNTVDTDNAHRRRPAAATCGRLFGMPAGDNPGPVADDVTGGEPGCPLPNTESIRDRLDPAIPGYHRRERP